MWRKGPQANSQRFPVSAYLCHPNKLPEPDTKTTKHSNTCLQVTAPPSSAAACLACVPATLMEDTSAIRSEVAQEHSANGLLMTTVGKIR